MQPEQRLQWARDMRAAAKQHFQGLADRFADDVNDTTNGRTKAGAGDGSGMAVLVRRLAGNPPLAEFAFISHAMGIYIGGETSGITGYLNTIIRGIRSYRDGLYFAVDQFDEQEEWSRRKVQEAETAILGKLGIEAGAGEIEAGGGRNRGAERVAQNGAIGDVGKSGVSDWTDVDPEAAYHYVMGVDRDAFVALQARLGEIAERLDNYSAKLKNGVADATDVWKGDGRATYAELGDQTVASMVAWAGSIRLLAAQFDLIINTIQWAQQEMPEAYGLYRKYKSDPSVSAHIFLDARNLVLTIAAGLTAIARIAAPSWQPPGPYQGLMIENAAGDPRVTLGPGAGPGGGLGGGGGGAPGGARPATPGTPNLNNNPALKKAIEDAKKAQKRAEEEAKRLRDLQKKLQEEYNKRDKQRQKELAEAIKEAQERTKKAQEEANKRAEEAIKQAQEAAKGLGGGLPSAPSVDLPNLGPGNLGLGADPGGVTPLPGISPTTPSLPGSLTPTTPGGGNGATLGGRTTPLGTEGDGNPIGGLPVLGAETSTLDGVGGTSLAANNGSQYPFIPPMMGGMMPGAGGAGGGGGGGGPLSGRPVRGGPRLVDPGAGNGPAAMSGRVASQRREQPKVVPLDGDGWTTEQAPAPAASPDRVHRPTPGATA